MPGDVVCQALLSVRRSGGFAIRSRRLFISPGLDVAFSLEADYKSALKWSSLFCLRISNPQERLAGLRFSCQLCFRWIRKRNPHRLCLRRGRWGSVFYLLRELLDNRCTTQRECEVIDEDSCARFLGIHDDDAIGSVCCYLDFLFYKDPLFIANVDILFGVYVVL